MSINVHIKPIQMSVLNALFVAVWLVLQAGQSIALEAVELNDSDRLVSLGAYAESFEDTSGELTVDEVLKSENNIEWSRSDVESLNFGLTASAYWLRVPIKNLSLDNSPWLFEIAKSNIDQIDIFVLSERDNSANDGSSAETRTRYQLGNKHSFDQRVVADPNFVIPLALEHNELTWLYLRVVNDFTMKLPMYILKQDALSEKRQIEFLVQGSYFGLMVIMALYNLFIYFSLRDKSYLYYTLFVVSFATWFFIENGYAFQYIWPNSVSFNAQINLTCIAIAATLSVVFANEFLCLKRQARLLHRCLKYLIYLWLGVIACALFLPVQTMTALIISIALPGGAFLLFLGIYMWSKGVRAARYYTIAWGVIIPGSMLFGLSSLGLIPSNFFTENSFQIGSVIEVFLFSLGLASRIKTAQQEKQQAQEESITYLGKYHTLYQNAVRGIFQATSKGQFISANPAFIDLLGYESESALVTSVQSFGEQHFVDTSEWTKFEAQTVGNDKVVFVEIKGKRVSGIVFWGELSAKRVPLPDNTGWLYEGTLLDISERKEKEAAQKESLLLKATVEKDRADAQLAQNQQLEERVQERTEKLEVALCSLSEANDKLLRLSTEDELTGVMNRRFFETNLEKEWKRSRRDQTTISLIVIDIDYFKAINDRYGHLAGDECLRQVTAIFKNVVHRPVDAISRYGGEEFVVTLPNTNQEGAEFIAESIRKRVDSTNFLFESESIELTVSLGVATTVPVAKSDHEDSIVMGKLFSRADTALYKAKNSGRNRVEVYQP